MQDFFIAESKSTPEIDFRYSEHRLALKGESYPENAAAFYGPVLDSLRHYLDNVQDQAIQIDVALIYFNSSSTKVLFTLFEMLNHSVRKGNDVQLNWYYDVEDDTMLEFGQDLHADFPDLSFQPIPIDHG